MQQDIQDLNTKAIWSSLIHNMNKDYVRVGSWAVKGNRVHETDFSVHSQNNSYMLFVSVWHILDFPISFTVDTIALGVIVPYLQG